MVCEIFFITITGTKIITVFGIIAVLFKFAENLTDTQIEHRNGTTNPQ